MQIQINFASVPSTPDLTSHIESQLNNGLDRFRERITRIEVHLTDVNGPRFGEHDKRCRMEVRLAGDEPFTVENRASGLHESINGAVDKLKTAVSRRLDKQNQHRQ